MTATARELLRAFEALDATEEQQVAVEILRRAAAVAEVSDEGFDALAAEIFRGYDAEEREGARAGD
jgi:hypothetical protein